MGSDIPISSYSQLNKQLTEVLFGNFFIYDLLSFLYPNNTCTALVLYVLDIGYPNKNNIFASIKYYSRWFGYPKGARITIKSMEELKTCLKEKQSVAMEVKYGENRTFYHSAILWFDNKNKIINLYDPAIEENIDIIDKVLGLFFSSELPEYKYTGNTLEPEYCVQNLLIKERGKDSFCVYYSWLYAIYRIKGLSHQEASKYLLDNRRELTKEIKELITRLANIAKQLQ